MAVEFKSSMSKNELLEIAAEHGIEADDSMKKNDILKLLEQARAAESAQEPQDGAETPPEGNDPAEGDEATQEPQDGEESTTGDSDTELPAEDAQEATPEGYGLFVYAGPSLPHGRLKEHAVFNGTFEDVKAYLADVLEDYPQAERLIVPWSGFPRLPQRSRPPAISRTSITTTLFRQCEETRRYKRWQTIFTAFRRVRTTRRFLPL